MIKNAKLTLLLALIMLAPQIQAAKKADSESEQCVSFALFGEDSFGRYSGELQIMKNKNVFRQVTYENFWQNKFQVESLWQGNLDKSGNAVFNIKNHTFLSEVDDTTLTQEQFQKTEVVKLNTKFLNTNKSCSKLTSPKMKREKKRIRQGYPNPILVKIAKYIAMDPIVRTYQKNPFLAPYKKNPDFMYHRYYATSDLTDLDFYQQNPSTLRLRNVNVNVFTLTEAQLKNSAFSHSLREKAEIMDKNTSDFNINSLGLFHHTIDGKFYPDGDSALWTGMYIAAQGAKFLATQDPEALAKVRKSLSGLLLLLEITKNSEEFARGAMPKDERTQVDDSWHLGTGKYSNVYWLPGGNNDMIKGLILGLIWGYKVIPHNDSLFSEMQSGLKKLKTVKLKRLQGLNQSYISGLDALFNSSPDAYVNFVKSYLTNQNALDLLGLNRQFYLQGVADWSGVNLSTVAALSFYLISDEIIKKWPHLPKSLSASTDIPDYSRDAHFIKKQQKKTIYQMNEVFKYAKRDFVCLMNHSLNSELGPAPKNCFISLIETPAELPEVSLGYDNRIKKDFTYAASPYLPWKFFGKKDNIIPDGLAGNQMYPMYEVDAFTSQMMWKESFGINDRKPRGAQIPRVDYLFSYWNYQMFQAK